MNTMKLFVWTCQPSFVAVAHARTIEEARVRMIEEVGAGGDGSCPERDKARRYIQENTPSIWYGVNAEFALTDSAELIEQADFLEKLQKKVSEARSHLGAALSQSIPKDDQIIMGHVRDAFKELGGRTPE